MKDDLMNLLKQGNLSNILTPQQGGGIEGLLGVVAKLEDHFRKLAMNMQVMGSGIDVSWLTNQMIIRLLIEKGIVTEEEVKAKYENEVTTPLKQAEQ